MCRSRRELSNGYLLAKIGVDTAENEPLEVWGENSIQYSIVSLEASWLAALARTVRGSAGFPAIWTAFAVSRVWLRNNVFTCGSSRSSRVLSNSLFSYLFAYEEDCGAFRQAKSAAESAPKVGGRVPDRAAALVVAFAWGPREADAAE